jgi:uncharacterized protein (TIGR03085 family)
MDSMTTSRPARMERAAFCDALTELGPDQPTLCSPWTTKDLAAHVVVRERRPDAAAGITVPFLAGHTAAVQAATAKRTTFEQLISLIRRPPWYSLAALGPADNATNTAEFFIHTEDARRAQPGFQPRTLEPAVARVLIGQLKLMSKLRLRKFPAKITININGYASPIVTGSATEPELTLTGDVGEITLFLSGRQRVSQVSLTGPDHLVDRLRSTDLGL